MTSDMIGFPTPVNSIWIDSLVDTCRIIYPLSLSLIFGRGQIIIAERSVDIFYAPFLSLSLSFLFNDLVVSI